MDFRIKENVLVSVILDDSETEVIVPSGIIEIGASAFSDCRGLESVVLPEELEIIGETAFLYCDRLKYIKIPHGVAEIQTGAFAYSGLLTIDLPDTLTTIGRKGFTNSKLRWVVIPDSVTDIGYGAFSYCSQLQCVHVGAGVTSIPAKAFGCTPLRKVWLPETVRDIDADAFLCCNRELVFTVKENTSAHRYAEKKGFAVCPDCACSFELRKLEKSRLTEFADNAALCGCEVPLFLSSIPVAKLKALPEHFYCILKMGDVHRIHEEGLSTLALWEAEQDDEACRDAIVFTEKRPKKTSHDGMRVKISLRHNPYYENLSSGQKQVRILRFGDRFLFCDSVHLLPEQCYFLDSYQCTDEDVRYGMLQLTNWDNICHIVIPDGYTRINDCAFSGSRHLETVSVGDSVEYIGNDSFSHCRKLHSVKIGRSVSLHAEHTRAFHHCPELRNVVMAAELKRLVLEKKAMCREAEWPWFANCPNLSLIRFTDGTSIRLTRENGE